MRAETIACLVMMGGVLSLPAAASAQGGATGGIAGLVRDATGAVLPGVTVEAASPALIEQQRTAVTDGEGRYQITDLRPGTYSVTFTLTGFSTFRREGIELTTGFTAAVNAELRVGALQETVTVTSASPVVDVQNVRQQTTLTREVLDTLPTGRTIQGFAALTVGASLEGAGGAMHDVGGNKGEQYGTIMIHGSRTDDGRLNFDGMRFNSVRTENGGLDRLYSANMAAVTEVAVETSGMSAEAETGGVQLNYVSKDGGNTFSVYFLGTGANGNLQNSNLTDRLQARGLTSDSQIHKIWDIGVGVGGPLMRDKLWFYTAHRWWGSQETYAGVFHNKTLGTRFYTPDRSRPFWNDFFNRDHSLRVTWQAAQKHKVTASHSQQRDCQCNFNALSGVIMAPEATTDWYWDPSMLSMGTWTYTATSRLLFEAGVARMYPILKARLQPEVTPADIQIFDVFTNVRYNSGGPLSVGNAAYSNADGADYSQHNERFLMSYITGSHAFRTGVHTMFGVNDYPYVFVPGDLIYHVLNGAPLQVMQWASPGGSSQRVKMLGLFAQDQWTVSKLTLNLGVRFDYVNAHIPEQVRPGGRFLPALHVDRIDNVPNYTDVSPRLGAAYDLFGNGKTALKVSLGRFVGAVATQIAQDANPANALAQSSTRFWNDQAFPAGDPRNGNFVPDCDLLNGQANGECGALDNRAFGTTRPNRRFAKDVLEGFGNRPYNWQTSVSVQHELRPGTSVNVGYFRTWFGNFQVIDNVLVGPEDFDRFSFTLPVDPRLPNGGGYRIDDLADIKPEKFGLFDNVVTQSSRFGKQEEVYDGIDATFNSRFTGGGLLQGGMNVGRTRTQCVVVDAPVQFCTQKPPFRPQFKLAGSYPLPVWDLQVAATFQNLPGAPYGTLRTTVTTAATNPLGMSYVARNAQIRPVLGRDLAQGAGGQVVMQLAEPRTIFEDRLTQLDLRFSKIVRLGRARVQGMFDIYNVFNADAILQNNGRYAGPAAPFLVPLQVMGGRLFKFSAQLNF